MSVGQHVGSIDLASESDFSLGRVRVKPSSREITHDAGVEVIEPRVMQVLVSLSRRSGQVVSRDLLMEECWAGRVVGEDAIQRAIAKIRRIAETGHFTIDTIARVGYRLNAEPPTTGVVGSTINDAKPPSRSRISLPLMAALGIAFVTTAWFGIEHWRSVNEQKIQLEETLTKAESLMSKDQNGLAFAAAYPLSKVPSARSDSRFDALWQKIVTPMHPLVAEDGAKVYFKPYEDVDGEWIFAGVSPIKEWIDAPRTPLRIKVEKPGFRTGYFTVAVPGPSVETPKPLAWGVRTIDPIPLPMGGENVVPENMVVVPRTNIPVFLTGWILDLVGGQQHDIPAFAISRYEVSNREFKEFIDAGGYEDARWWEGLDFSQLGRKLSWSEARERFVDSTHRPGPAGWQLSTYPREQADFPFGGISWYEAVAYARFRGLQLPTIHHWMRAAYTPLTAIYSATPTIAAKSHFRAQSPTSVRNEIGLGPWGTYHMLGNVREWVSNRSGNEAIALGSSWSQFPVDSNSIYTADPMSRAPDHGFRLMQPLTNTSTADAAIPDALLKPIQLVRNSDAVKREPASDDTFKAMRFQFSTAKSEPLEVVKQEVHRTSLLVVEEVILTFANEEPTTLYIARPSMNPKQPLQAIVYGPGGNCCYAKRPNRDNLENLRDLDFIANGGRVIVMPIWKGSYSRVTPMPIDTNARLDRGRRAALAWHHDLTATLNYLETQQDIDATKFGYLGYSSGGTYQGTLLAIEPRIKAAVFVSAGIPSESVQHPMIDMINYAPRITIPLLLINGRYDHHHPFEQSQHRLFTLLGTPVDKKRHIIYDTGHFAFQGNAVVADVSNWFDKYLGPAR